LVLDVTPFYAESGGQVGDTGILDSPNDIVQILDTKRENGVIIHITDKLPENLTAHFHAKVDGEKRALTDKVTIVQLTYYMQLYVLC
jgi:alanyl-tRNA synthetase